MDKNWPKILKKNGAHGPKWGKNAQNRKMGQFSFSFFAPFLSHFGPLPFLIFGQFLFRFRLSARFSFYAGRPDLQGMFRSVGWAGQQMVAPSSCASSFAKPLEGRSAGLDWDGTLYSVLLFLGFLDFLGTFEARNFLGYFGVFSVFSKDFEGSAGTEKSW